MRKAIISDREESQVMSADGDDAVGIHLVLLPMLEPIQKAIAVRGLYGDPGMGAPHGTPAGHQVDITVVSSDGDERR